jgi:hypothetical protein
MLNNFGRELFASSYDDEASLCHGSRCGAMWRVATASLNARARVGLCRLVWVRSESAVRNIALSAVANVFACALWCVIESTSVAGN